MKTDKQVIPGGFKYLLNSNVHFDQHLQEKLPKSFICVEVPQFLSFCLMETEFLHSDQQLFPLPYL